MPVNQPPTLNFIPNPPSVAVGAGQQTINLSGISRNGRPARRRQYDQRTVTNGGNGYTSTPTVSDHGRRHRCDGQRHRGERVVTGITSHRRQRLHLDPDRHDLQGQT